MPKEIQPACRTFLILANFFGVGGPCELSRAHPSYELLITAFYDISQFLGYQSHVERRSDQPSALEAGSQLEGASNDGRSASFERPGVTDESMNGYIS